MLHPIVASCSSFFDLKPRRGSLGAFSACNPDVNSRARPKECVDTSDRSRSRSTSSYIYRYEMLCRIFIPWRQEHSPSAPFWYTTYVNYSALPGKAKGSYGKNESSLCFVLQIFPFLPSQVSFPRGELETGHSLENSCFELSFRGFNQTYPLLGNISRLHIGRTTIYRA